MKSEFTMKSSVRVCLYRKSESGKSLMNQESQKLLSIVGETWSSKLIKISTWNGHERQ